MGALEEVRVAVDIGGTFTDIAICSGDGELISTHKTPTTSDDPARGAFDGVNSGLGRLGLRLTDVVGFVHGATLATNALIERRGACVATASTEGFRDILEIAYERRYSQYDVFLEKPDLIVPRSRSFTVSERVRVDGAVLTPLDERDVERLVQDIEAAGAEAVAICLLHAYAAPEHERRIAAILREQLPDLAISLSSEVSPEAREFERLCTTVANAYIQPLMSSYLARFQALFSRSGLACPIMMMTSGGGMTTVETARRIPIRLVESGPSGGAVLAARTAESIGASEVLSFDMGGTTAKLCLIDAFRPQTARKFEISRAARFIKGSGMPVRIPVIEMIEIGAGGGSIADVDDLGRIAVGPRSAGSTPGPAAFGRGGVDATVTDADALLGYIAEGPIGDGAIVVDAAAAAAAMAATVGSRLSIETEDAAFGVSEIVDENMASAGRMHAVESGKDLGSRVLIAFGGNGPLHATRVARRAGVSSIVVPKEPSVGSAVGFLAAPVSFETVRTRYTPLSKLDLVETDAFLRSMAQDAVAVVRDGAGDVAIDVERVAFMRYRGQGHEIEVGLPPRALEEDDIEMLASAFENAYRAQFARAVPGMEIEILNWRVTASTRTSPPPVAGRPKAIAPAAPTATRMIVCDRTGRWIEAKVFERERLRPGDYAAGPALIVERHTSTLVSADFDAAIDDQGNLWLTRRASQEMP